MTKQFVNDPAKIVDEALLSLISSNRDLVLLDGFPEVKVVARASIDPHHVGLISGGGSGHEPAHSGYIGQGALTAAVCGPVFASPSVEAVLSAILHVAGSTPSTHPGVLLLVKNYTGDRLNFGLAAELAKQQGIAVEMVVIADDVALDDASERITGNRGIAGTVLFHKMLGAAAAEGQSLPQLVALASTLQSRIATMGCALSSCTLPGKDHDERIPPGHMEVGLGIHGEPGRSVVPLAPAHAIMAQLLDRIMTQKKFGKRVAVLVNNLGSMTPLELGACMHNALELCVSKYSLQVERVFSGSFMTSLDMHGISLSLLNLDDETELLAWLDAKTTAPAWPQHSCVYSPRLHPASAPLATAAQSSLLPPTSSPPPSTPFSQASNKTIRVVCQRLVQVADELTEADRLVGDGDMGIIVSAGAKAILEATETNRLPLHDPIALFRALGGLVRRSMGGTSGALYDILFNGAAAHLAANQNGSLVDALDAGVKAVMKYGGANRGDRTMLDAWCPAMDAMRASVKGDMEMMLHAAAEAARRGSDATRGMHARAGRSSYVSDEQTARVPDPGAMAVAEAFEALRDGLGRG